MFKLKKKHLRREDFINSFNSKKIWSKSMTLPEIKELLEKFEIELSKYEYENDKNFLMNTRRSILKRMVDDRLEKDDNVNAIITDSLFNFWEFVSDEYSGSEITTSRETGLSIKEVIDMNNAYSEKGIICAEERDIILEMIHDMKKRIG